MFNEAVEAQYHQAKQQQIAENLEVQHLHNAVLENMETWETASVMYMPFDFSKVPVEERKFVRLLAKDLIEVDWSTQSMKNWVTKLQHLSNKNFIISCSGQIAVVFNSCSKSTQDRLLASNFGLESADATYTFITLIKTLGAIYSSVNHAQQELGRGLKQGGGESMICFLKRI